MGQGGALAVVCIVAGVLVVLFAGRALARVVRA